MHVLSSISIKDRRDLYIALTAPVIGFLALKLIVRLASAATYTGILPKPRILQAPEQQQYTTPIEKWNAPYPPDALPGGRNVSTPYGNIRAYEWGPEQGRKVLFLHGISTPSIALARLASRLVDSGCRVMLFDLFGRGYSDAPDPNAYPQDINLFSFQILSVVATSKLNWTDGFTLCGYSLGGGIVAEFTSYFPSLIESLVLIAPGGVLRTNRISFSSKMLYSGLLPDPVVHHLIMNKLRSGSKSNSGVVRRSSIATSGKFSVTDAASEELPDNNSAHAQDSNSPIFDDRPHISSASAVRWQLENHPGFVPAFVSSVKHAPIHDGHERWRLVGERCAAQRAGQGGDGLKQNRVLVLLGEQDVVISSDETDADAKSAFGQDNVEVVRLQGGHDLPVTNSDGCVEAMMAFWRGAAVRVGKDIPVLQNPPEADHEEVCRFAFH